MNTRESILQKLRDNIICKYLTISSEEPFDYESHKIEVIAELQFHIGNNTYSDYFLNQLVFLHALGYIKINNKYNPYHIKQIYEMLEKIVSKKVEYKPFKKEKSFLYGKGILHVHHSQSFYIEDNHIRYFERKYRTNADVIKRLNEIEKERPGCNSVIDLVYESFQESMQWNKKTGEWILFQVLDNSFYFIGLALHNYDDFNDEILSKIIMQYVKHT